MLKCTIAVNRQKLEVMKALNNRELINRLTLDQRETRLFLRIGTPTIKVQHFEIYGSMCLDDARATSYTSITLSSCNWNMAEWLDICVEKENILEFG